MERQPLPQQVEIVSTRPEVHSKRSWKHLAVVILLMLWPWLCVSVALFYAQSFQLAIVVYELLCCVLPLFVLGKLRHRWHPLSFPIGALVLLVVLANILILTGWKISNGYFIQWEHVLARLEGIQLHRESNFLLYGFVMVFLNPLVEETFWRGLVYEEWKHHVNPLQAALISSLFFGGWHWVILQHFCYPIPALILTLIVVAGGLIFTWAYEKTGALLTPMLLHGLGADLPLMFIAYSGVYNAATLSA